MVVTHTHDHRLTYLRNNLESNSVNRILARDWNPTTPQRKVTQSYNNVMTENQETESCTHTQTHIAREFILIANLCCFGLKIYY